MPIFQEETGILLPSSGKVESVFGGSEASACGFEILKSLQVSFYFAPGMNQKLRQRLHQFTDLILRRKIVSMPQNHKMQDGVMVETIVVPVGTAFFEARSWCGVSEIRCLWSRKQRERQKHQ